MGQRHQIYLRIPTEQQVCGIHHQWLYGCTALRSLANFLTFAKNSKDFTGKAYGYELTHVSNAERVLQAVYSIDVNEGYYHQTHILQHGEPEQPTKGDNNNGITVIDLSGDKPKYCFSALYDGHLECLDDSVDLDSIKAFKPMGAREYIELHYPNCLNPENNGLTQEEFNQRSRPTEKTEKEKQKRFKEMDADKRMFREQIQRLVAMLDGYEVLTKKELKEIFPKEKIKVRNAA